MSEFFDSQSDLIQSGDSSPVRATAAFPETCATEIKVSAPSLKLVPTIISAPVYESTSSQHQHFTAEVRKRSPYDFVMVARDPFHYLHCDLPLTFEENQWEKKRSFSLVCQFPTICDEELADFINDDEDLLGITLITFHMQILKNLFVFCSTHQAHNLIIKATEEQFAALGIYHEFIKHVDKIPTKQGISIEITILIHSKSLAQCNEFIDDMMAQFRKTLWGAQSTNSAIRDYLKTNVRLSIVT
jgi:hypothetical protein